MLSRKPLQRIRALRRRREQVALSQHAKILRTIADIDRRQADVERIIKALQQSRMELFAGLSGCMTRAELYRLKRQESYVELQLVEAWANMQALDTERYEAAVKENAARLRVSESHYRLEKIEHVQKHCRVLRMQEQNAQEDNEAEERRHDD